MARRHRSKGHGTLFKRNGHGAWRAAWYDHEGRRRERSTRTTDRAAAERILAKRVADAALRREGVIDARAEAVTQQGHRPIADHLHDWRAALQAKANSPKRIAVACGRTERIAAGCKFS